MSDDPRTSKVLVPFSIHWSEEMGMYKVSIPTLNNAEVYLANRVDEEIKLLHRYISFLTSCIRGGENLPEEHNLEWFREKESMLQQDRPVGNET